MWHSSLLYATGVLLGANLVASMGLDNRWAQEFKEMADRGELPDGPWMHRGGNHRWGPPPPPVSYPNNTNETIVPEYVQIPLDHFGGGDYEGIKTYPNRFWVAESGYRGGPVFIYDTGEANAQPNALFRLQNSTSFFKQMVDAFGGIGIVWEHRYYGTSVPVNITLDTPPEAFRYLTTEQSLADVVTFASNFSRPDIHKDLTPAGTPWVFVGGSYPGMRAAFMREFYPDTITASFASSAPVEAKVDMSVYFEPVYRGMNAYGFGNCTADIHAAILYMDKLMEFPAAAAALKERFLGRGAANNSNPTFADALTTIFYQWQSYGVEGGSLGLRAFCDYIETDPATNATAPAEGWAASKGANYTVARWASFPYFYQEVNSYMTTDCEGPFVTNKTAAPPDCNLDLRFEDPASISWTWQYCTQWGYFQSANLGPSQIVSSYNSLQHQADICHRQFPTAKAPLFPDWPRTDATNAHFGGWSIRPSNVYWSGGEYDPWRTLSPLSNETWAPHPLIEQNIPQCGVSTSESEIFGYVMDNAEHAFDFRTTFPPGETSRGYFYAALKEWLKCWKPSGKTGRPWSA